MDETGTAFQHAQVVHANSGAALPEYGLSMCVSISRAAYGQLTEGGPVPSPPSKDVQRFVNGATAAAARQQAVVENLHMPGAIYIDLQEGCGIHRRPVTLAGFAEQTVAGDMVRAYLPTASRSRPEEPSSSSRRSALKRMAHTSRCRRPVWSGHRGGATWTLCREAIHHPPQHRVHLRLLHERVSEHYSSPSDLAFRVKDNAQRHARTHTHRLNCPSTGRTPTPRGTRGLAG